MVNISDFAKRLQKILDYYAVTATAFSEEINFNRSTISHLLSGRNKPSLEFVMKVLQKYPEVELYWLLNGKGEFPSEKKTTSPPVPKLQNNTAKEIEATFSEKSSQNIDKTIDRIVIFYRDGSFKAYEN
ncbi:MAG: transcriptional regulator with XRE-family HTH domain [Ulvibacter sp.]|jgi:transcriptional regulator with XRE-family HTH domain